MSHPTPISAFGSVIYTRSWSDVNRVYRFGFNGKEEDKEGIGVGGTTYDYGFRIFNPSIGRFLSTDLLLSAFPWYTLYQYSGNKPIWCIDIDGLEDAPTNNGTGTTIRAASDPNTVFINPVVFSNFTVQTNKHLTLGKKATIFGINFGISAVISGAVAAVVAVIASPVITTVAIVAGIYVLAKGVTELVSGNSNWGFEDELTESEKWAEAGSLVGGVVGRIVGAKLGLKVKSAIQAKNSNSKRTSDPNAGKSRTYAKRRLIKINIVLDDLWAV